MTEFRAISSGEVITTHNNMNNVRKGDYIEVNKDNGKHIIKGNVSKISHLISAWHNHECKERSTHDLIIEIED